MEDKSLVWVIMATRGEMYFPLTSQWFTIRPMHTALTLFLSQRPTGCREFTFEVKGQRLGSLVSSHKDTKTPSQVLSDITRTAVRINPAGASVFPIVPLIRLHFVSLPEQFL